MAVGLDAEDAWLEIIGKFPKGAERDREQFRLTCTGYHVRQLYTREQAADLFIEAASKGKCEETKRRNIRAIKKAIEEIK